MDPERIAYLLQQYEDDRITTTEREELYALLRSFDNNEEILAWLEDSYYRTNPQTLEPGQWQPVVENILRQQKVVALQPYKKRNLWWIAAACIIVLAGIGSYFTLFNKPSTSLPQPMAVVHDVNAPEDVKAMIRLADGRKVALDSLSSGSHVLHGGVKLIKNEDGQIAYQSTGQVYSVEYNTLTNPRGSKVVSLILSDGTKVWLNNESSLRYPIGFSGKDRTVELTGEGYFEVAQNVKMPFQVKVNDMMVQVLGTHFNINSFSNEPAVRTTLLEGKVKITKGEKLVYLYPGQQAITSSSESSFRINYDVDTDEVMAWKEGRFTFNRADVETIMRQIERWYDVDVSYERKINSGTFSGIVSRDRNISEVLKIMEAGGIKFKIEGKKIIVIQ